MAKFLAIRKFNFATVAILLFLATTGVSINAMRPAAAGDRSIGENTGMAPPGTVSGRARTCQAAACLALTISDEAVERWRTGRPAGALPISGLMGSFMGERTVAVTLLLASYTDGVLVEWTTRRPTVARIGPRDFRADGVRPLVRPGGAAATELPDFAMKHIDDGATLELAEPIPGVAANTGWWLQAAHFRNGPPERLAAFGPGVGHTWWGAQQTLLIALVPQEPAATANTTGEPWVMGTAPLFFRTP